MEVHTKIPDLLTLANIESGFRQLTNCGPGWKEPYTKYTDEPNGRDVGQFPRVRLQWRGVGS